MFNDLLHPAFVMTSDGVAINVTETTGDNVNTSGQQLSDLLRNVMISDGTLRVVTSV